MSSAARRIRACRFCGGPLDLSLLDLGEQPLANRLLREDELARPEPRWPLHVRVCGRCRLVQHDVEVAPEQLFADYPYFSATSRAWVEHARRFAEAARDRFGLGPTRRVVEIASNDGYLVRHFVAMGIPVLGIDPATNVAAIARAAGIPTEARFFGDALAEELVGRGLGADLVVANNVLAHVPQLFDVLTGVRRLLTPEGVLAAEFPHLLRLLENVEFDTIYHEHFFYFSLLAFERVAAAAGLRLLDVEELATHGGSLRIYAAAGRADPAPGDALARVRAAELAAGLDRPAGYSGFAPRVEALAEQIRRFVRGTRAAGSTIAAFGAAAKGATLLNYCGLGAADIAFVADETPAKIGRYLPGSHVPVVTPEALAAARPDYVLILPWNHADEITMKLGWVRSWGGRFVVPVPTVRVL
jgi:SAM-dependent methyltransferase